MCLIVFAWDVHPKYKLILAANRDEFYDRPSSPAGFWQDHPDILGGRDLKAGGSWMTVSSKGHVAAVTNYRDISNIKPDANSRGELPTGFMLSDCSPSAYIQQLHEHSETYNGFNILAATMDQMVHYSNYERKLNIVDRGIYGLSNALLDTNWPKVERAKRKFQTLVDDHFTHEQLIEMMGDTKIAEEAILPETGIPKEMEKALSAMCIRTENYGTCCSTVITLDRNGEVNFTEKSFPVGGRQEQTVHFQLTVK